MAFNASSFGYGNTMGASGVSSFGNTNAFSSSLGGMQSLGQMGTSQFSYGAATPNYGTSLAASQGLGGSYQPAISNYSTPVSYPSYANYSGATATAGGQWAGSGTATMTYGGASGLTMGGTTTFLPSAAAPAIGYGNEYQGASLGASSMGMGGMGYPAPAAAAAPSTFLAQAASKVIVVGVGRLHSDKLTEALEVVRNLQEQSRSEKGCDRYEWSSSLDDPTLLVIYECWESENDLQEHLDSEHVRVFKEQVQELFAIDPSVQKTSISVWEDI